MQKLKFYDLKKRKIFISDKYVFVIKETKRGRRKFAVAIAPSGSKSYRIVSINFKG